MSTDRFRPDLKCYVRQITYDFRTRSGELIIGHDSCADMKGCIALFQAIDPKVWCIQTYRGRNKPHGSHEPDTDYVLREGEWVAEPMCVARKVEAR